MAPSGYLVILRRPARHPGPRLLGLAILAIGLLRVPLPRADYHEIRHRHGAGEVCVHHDHLLRWHPGIGGDDSVALFHWHWLIPTAQGLAGDEEDDAPATALAFHAHADGLEPDWPGDQAIQSDLRGRLFHSPGCVAPPIAPRLLASDLPAPPRGLSGLGFGARGCEPFRPLAPPAALSQRWNC
jgi:hypothetical protein